MRINWFSNAPWSASGYGNQTKLFVPRLQGLGHEMSITAFWGLEGSILTIDGPRGKIPVYPRGYMGYGQDIWSAAAGHFKADVCISLMDAWVFDPERNPNKVQWVPWFPVDSEPIQQNIVNNVKKAHSRIVFSKHGERMVKEAGLDCYYVPHGVDCDIFKPGDRAAARQTMKLPADVFLVGMVAANKGNPSRKAFQPQLEAFAQFHKKHPDTLLYLHTQRGESMEYGGVNLPELCAFLGLEEGRDVLFCDQFTNLVGYPDRHMAMLYNAFDVHMLASMGEGFGIPILEAQASGCPVIVGDWTAMPELCFSGWKISKNEAEPWWNPMGVYQYMPHAGAVAERLEAAYEMRGNDAYRRRARDGALAYDADKITEKYWKPVLDEIELSITGKIARRHSHQWIDVGLYNEDGTLSVPCSECGAEMIVNERGQAKRVIEGGFSNPLDLQFSEPDGLEWLLLRECERDYDQSLNLTEASTVIDIGAHVGVVSLYLAKKYGCTVYAYEPNPANFRRLCANKAANGLDEQIEAYHLAVTGDGRDVLISTDPHNSGGGTIYEGQGETVHSTTIDKLLDEPVDLLKIDCEGAEFEILANPEILRGKVRAIRGEIHRGSGDADALVESLRGVCANVILTVVGK